MSAWIGMFVERTESGGMFGGARGTDDAVRAAVQALVPELTQADKQAPLRCKCPPNGSAPDGAVGLLLMVYPDGRASLNVRRGQRMDSLFNFAPLDDVLRKAWPTALAETREYLGLHANAAADAGQASATTR